MNMCDVFTLRESLTNRYHWATAADIVFVIGQKEFSTMCVELDYVSQRPTQNAYGQRTYPSDRFLF